MKQTKGNIIWLVVAFIVGACVMAGLAALLISIHSRKMEAVQYPLKIVEIADTELDPAVWGRNFPREYDSFRKTENTTIQTKYGGSVKYSKLKENPRLVRLWAGHPFSVDYNSARGHHYALIDQKATKRQQAVVQPGACANCHAAEAPLLIAQMGWKKLNKTPYKEIQEHLHLGTSCADCHDPKTMNLRITRPAFVHAMRERGVDLTKATRQEMRTYVCAQCHVEYYFAGENRLLTYPWDHGLEIENIERYYDELGFKDWRHKESGAPLIKMQHPEFELWSSGIHAQSGVMCADCHMPYVREGAIKVSDHWIRSPLTDVSRACQPCHRQNEDELKRRVVDIQDKTHDLLQKTEAAIVDAIDAIATAQKSGASDADLLRARDLHRKASIRWDFIASENSTGFHSPREAARILACAINYARQGQVEAIKATRRQTAKRSWPDNHPK